MPLTQDELILLIELTQQEVVAEFDSYKVVRPGNGYSLDSRTAQVQAKLSMMLEAKSRVSG